MIRKGAFGVHLFENRSDENLNCLKNTDGKNIHPQSTQLIFHSQAFHNTIKQQSGLAAVGDQVSQLYLYGTFHW